MTASELAIEVKGQATANPQSDAFDFVGVTGDFAYMKILPALHNSPAHGYKPGSWGPAEADAMAADIGGWHDPQ